jgi:hypothetical protein
MYPKSVADTNRFLSSPGYSFDAQINVLEYKSIIAAGFQCMVHCHTAIEEVTLKVSALSCASSRSFLFALLLVPFVCGHDDTSTHQLPEYL